MGVEGCIAAACWGGAWCWGCTEGLVSPGWSVLRRWRQVLREGVLRLKVEGLGEWPTGTSDTVPGRQRAGRRPEVFRGWRGSHDCSGGWGAGDR